MWLLTVLSYLDCAPYNNTLDEDALAYQDFFVPFFIIGCNQSKFSIIKHFWILKYYLHKIGQRSSNFSLIVFIFRITHKQESYKDKDKESINTFTPNSSKQNDFQLTRP